MHKFVLRLLALSSAIALLGSGPGYAVEQGDWLVRLGPAWVGPNSDSNTVTTNGTPIAGSEVGVDDAWTLGFTIDYMATDHIGVELLGVLPPRHDIEGEETLSSVGDIASTRVLPPSLLFQYHFMPKSKIKPYIGVGVNYTIFYNEEGEGSFSGSTVSIDDSWGVAAQAGIDYNLKGNWYLNAAFWWADIDANASIRRQDGALVRTNADIDPFIVMFGGGYRF